MAIELKMKTLSSLEKVFWDDDLDKKVEKREFYMFKN